MNHIHNLTAQRNHLSQVVSNTESELSAFIAYLQTASKFTGTGADGSRKDWISTGDAIARLQEIRATLQTQA